MEMENSTHPVLQDMLQLGCSNQRVVAIAFQIYMELCEVRALWDVQYTYCRELDLIYITGKETKSQEHSEIYVPLPASAEISPAWISKVQEILCATRGKKSITLALRDSDATAVYYQVSEGLERPDSPESVQKKKLKEEKRRVIQSELRRQHDKIYNAAKDISLSGGDPASCS